MQEIYVVTSGSYSDYGINAVFSTEELANKFIESFKDDGYNEMRVESFQLDPHKSDLSKNRKPFRVRIDKEGNITEVYHCDNSHGFERQEQIKNISYTFDKKQMNVFCFADDIEHAIKIAGERRTQVLASNIWGVIRH